MRWETAVNMSLIDLWDGKGGDDINGTEHMGARGKCQRGDDCCDRYE